jgi:uncharacterized protein
MKKRGNYVTPATMQRPVISNDEAKRRYARNLEAAMAHAGPPKSTVTNPFKLPSYPPGVAPASSTGMAMDDSTALMGPMNWAAANSILYNGESFLGYPYLAELAQKPEYRRISEIIAKEMTRKWIRILAKGDADKTKKVDQINDEFEKLRVQEALREIAEHDGHFGRAHLYIDIGVKLDDRDELRTPIGDGWNNISKMKVKKGSLERFKAIEPVWCYPTNYNSNDPLDPHWYAPEHWIVMGKEIHASRLPTFVGREVPDLLKPSYAFGGLSLSQMARPYVENWTRIRQSVAELVHSFTVSGVQTNLGESLAMGGDQLFQRAELFNRCRDNKGLMLLDKDTEEFFNVSTPLGGLDLLQAQSQEHMAAVSGIPIVKLLGIQPAGLNASSEGEINTFYDWIASYQESFFRQKLHSILGFIQLSTFGDVDEDITFRFEPLEALSEKEMAEVRKIEAETDQIYIDTGVLAPLESRTRIAAQEDSAYASLDVDDLPDLLDEEEHGLIPKGGGSGGSGGEGGEGEE